jgi:OOP family OmpA-OmpF porin
MATPSTPRDHRSRRAVLQQGAGALATLFLVGALVMKPRIQSGLEDEARRALDAAGIPATVDFVFQDGRILCVDELDDPQAARRIVLDVRGVRSATLDPICVDGPPPDVESTTSVVSSTTASPDTTTLATSATTTTAVPTTTAAPSTTEAVPADNLVAVVLDGGRLTLRGTVGSQQQATSLRDAAAAAVDPANVVDQLTVDTSLALDDSDVSIIATLVAAMPVPLVRGEVGWNASDLTATGQYVDEASRDAFRAACTRAGVTPSLEPRLTATPDDAADVETAINSLVKSTPILFGKGEIVISPQSVATVEQIAGIVKRFGGTSIEVQGHTDSEGDPGRNLTLSENRAKAVADALVRLGVPAAEVTSKGFGETQLIRDENGAEIPDQSRRVVFGVTTTN